MSEPGRDSDRGHLSAGRRLGPYEIVEPIGAGGMGEVYRARDTRLHREVALKVLPPALVADPTRRERFVQEARAASALEHPHIAVIHEIGDADGITFIAMELLRGEPLSNVIARGPLRPTRALELASEMAEGLARAHETRIVHRDLKPANVMLTEDGHAKIIDFGLAKLVEALGQDATAVTAARNLTESGMVLGTPVYMSPEQTLGRPVDHRSDIFSFGTVLYEMVTGRPPFRGQSRIDTMHAILRDPAPPLSSSIGPATGDLQRVLDKCLAKDPADRYQGMRDLVVDLRAARRRLESSSVRATSTSGDRTVGDHLRVRPWMYGAGALVLFALVAVVLFESLRSERPAPTDRARWVQLTNLDFATQPALSPDGRMLAFVRGSGTFATDGQIYLKMLPSGDAVPLTQDALPKMAPVFSPDGTRIAYTANSAQDPWATWMVPALRGEPRRWLRNASGLTWVDHDHLLFSEIKQGQHMGIVTSTETRAESRDIYFPRDEVAMAHRSYRSPDGKWLLIVEMDAGGVWLPCRLVPFAGGSTGQSVGPSNAPCTSAAWSTDGEWMYLSANNGDGFHIWRQRFTGGEPEQLTSGPTEEEGVAVAPDNRSLITSVGFRQRSVWIHDGSGERQVSLEGYAFWPLLSADGRRVCFRVRPTPGSGQSPSELWIVDLVSGRAERLLDGQMITGFDLSGDDRVVAAVPEPDGKSRLWLAWLDGREAPRRVAAIEGDAPRFGATGEILFRSPEGNSHALTSVGVDGLRQRRLAPVPNFVFGEGSPDRQRVSVSESRSLDLYSTRGEPPIRFFTGASVSRLRWSGDGSRLYASFQTGDATAFSVGRTYVIPLSNGSMLPHIPDGGFHTQEELAVIPGVQVLPYADVAPGPTPVVYAFSRMTITRNLYRIPLP